MQTALLGLV